ncbi:UvrD-helicase domain-containing protein [bacterium]|nr:UvrD-helicase domain-containing protein [bacterium]
MTKSAGQSEYCFIETPDQIDLDHHAVIEASAGTGKTYTLENLVIRLIKNRVPLEKIVMVTFTEKATGELKERIRLKLEQEADRETDPDLRTLLEQALTSFEKAQISTIHGFCQMVLREYAFENGLQFEQKLCDDLPLYRKLLQGIIRQDWPARYKEHLGFLLTVSDFPAATARGTSTWIENVLNIVSRYQPEAGDKLLPEPESLLDPESMINRLNQLCTDLDAAIGPVEVDDVTTHPFYLQYNSLKMNGNRKKNILATLIVPLLELGQVLHLGRQQVERSIPFETLIAFLDQCQNCKAYKEFGFQCLISAQDENAGNDTITNQLRLPVLIELLEDLDNEVKSQQKRLMAQTVSELKMRAAEYKREHGLISYDDMLVLLKQALDPTRNRNAGLLLSSVRERFRFALVDEFQDTDLVQWDIFKKIFVDQTGQTDHRLIVIGDPKQAIYGFRGADVQAYLTARRELLTKHGAILYGLAVNWRSMPDMITTLNKLFSSQHWFSNDNQTVSPTTDRIVFYEAREPGPKRRARLLIDRTDREAVSFIRAELAQANSPHKAETLMAAFIADEIKRLLENRIYFAFDDSARWLAPSDICILIRKSSEALSLEQALRDRSIPFSYYKKTGLYQSDEALQLSFLLQAIAAPADRTSFKKALLTRFFNWTAPDLEKFEQIGPEHLALKNIEYWHVLSRKRQWPKLFKDIVDRTGLALREIKEFDGERRLTNFYQLIEDLIIYADSNQTDIDELCRSLENKRRYSLDLERDANLHQLETEQAQVQIMTIHNSKGLEFPVVFLAGGYARSKSSEQFYKIHQAGPNGSQSVVFDLEKRFKDQFLIEQTDEDKRLYYVALTRAIFKLYVPIFKTRFSPGPICTLVTPASQDVLNLPHARVIDQISDPPTQARIETPEFHIPEPLLPSHLPSFWPRRLELESFSHLNARLKSHEAPSSLLESVPPGFLPDQEERDDEDPDSDGWAHERELSPSPGPDRDAEIPRGPVFGNMIHSLFEKVDFKQIARCPDPVELLSPGNPVGQVLKTVIDTEWPEILPRSHKSEYIYQVVADMIWKTLMTRLEPIEITLAELGPDARLHELEFLSCRLKKDHNASRDRQARKVFLKGYIDLVFRHRDKLYLLDWKSNLLESGYDQASISQCMVQHNYYLQYKIYALALELWLKQIKQNLSLAGVYYLFVRGLDPASPRSGVFFEAIDDRKLDQFKNELGWQ